MKRHKNGSIMNSISESNDTNIVTTKANESNSFGRSVLHSNGSINIK